MWSNIYNVNFERSFVSLFSFVSNSNRFFLVRLGSGHSVRLYRPSLHRHQRLLERSTVCAEHSVLLYRRVRDGLLRRVPGLRLDVVEEHGHRDGRRLRVPRGKGRRVGEITVDEEA